MPRLEIKLVKREEWGAMPPKVKLPEMPHPALMVVTSLRTDFGECHNKEECMEKVRKIQKQHMEEWGLPDISYNFLIGNDGYVYEGRGWEYKCAKATGQKRKFEDRTYDIGLIGDYSDEIPDDMYYLNEEMLKYGEDVEFIGENFKWEGYYPKKRAPRY